MYDDDQIYTDNGIAPWDESADEQHIRIKKSHVTPIIIITIIFSIIVIMIFIMIFTICIMIINDYNTPERTPGDNMMFEQTLTTPHIDKFVKSHGKNISDDTHVIVNNSDLIQIPLINSRKELLCQTIIIP